MRSMPTFSIALLASGFGMRLASPITFSAIGLPWASIPTASTTASGPRPAVRSRSAPATSSTSLTSMTSAPVRR